MSDDLGLFARLSWRSGQTEIVAWTDTRREHIVRRRLEGNRLGAADRQSRPGWRRYISGLSGNYQSFLRIGGLGINIGDGALNYRPESIVETYYSVGLTNWAALTFDYQFFANPAHNYVRGPVSIGSVRLHVQF